ncbi:MAG: branched-chain amino acid ABC transporter permease [Alphaproteobacteria bacterium]|nr:MAG: branched-chain amino acid ABC transporter permease [Alphaproteobacteria bacterium]
MMALRGLRDRMIAARAMGGALLLAGLAAPWLASEYVLSVLIVSLWFAYVGQAWNIMMGFAGQLSLGHAMYVGLGAYAAAGLFVFTGIGPWLGAPLAVIVAVIAGAGIGWLGFRFQVKGVYFALLTIAFAEFTRILFDHITVLGGSGGLFLPVGQRSGVDLINLRGGPVMFYYVIFVMTVAITALSWALLRTRLGYQWQAIREDAEAAEAVGVPVFRTKLLAVMLSAGLTALGGVFFAFYYNTLFPEQIFAKSRSIEMILAPIIGGMGTVLGPLVGALLLTPLGELTMAVIAGLGVTNAGVRQVVFGVLLILVLWFLPQGVWPWLTQRWAKGRRQ